MSAYYAPYRDGVDGAVMVCSECGSQVPDNNVELHNSWHDRVQRAGQQQPPLAVLTVETPKRTDSRVEQRRALRTHAWNNAIESGLIVKMVTPTGRESYKFNCTVCGREGGGPGGDWWKDCVKGHPFVCTCGRMFASMSSLASHTTAQRRSHPELSHRFARTT